MAKISTQTLPNANEDMKQQNSRNSDTFLVEMQNGAAT